MVICILGNAHSIHRQRFARFYAQAGYEVHIISPRPIKLPFAHVHSVGWPRLGPLSAMRELAAYLWLGMATLRLSRRLGADVVEGHYISLNGLPAVLATDCLRVLVTYGDDITTDPEFNSLMRWMVRVALRRADLILTEDYPSRIQQLKALGACLDRIVINNWGIDTEKFHPNARSERLRQCLVPKGRHLVISVRPVQLLPRFGDDQYDIRTLIEAIPQTVSRCPDAHFLLLGDTPEAFQRLIPDNATLPNTVLGGRVPYSDMPSYLASADLFVDTYYPKHDKRAVSHNFGQGLMEAMSCGLPTLVADRIGIQEAPYYEGAIYASGDADDLARRVVGLLEDARWRTAMGALNRQVIKRHYDWHTNMQQVAELYCARLQR